MTVGIVGAGVAGLRAAQLLERAGVEIALFDARRRIGGRLMTCELPDGTRYEAGGEWIDADQRRTLAWLEELGARVDSPHQWPGLVWYEDELCPENVLWPDAQQAEQRLYAIVKSDEFAEGHLSDLLDTIAGTPRARWWLEARIRSDEGEDTNRIGRRSWTRAQSVYADREAGAMSAHRVEGGWSEALRSALKSLRANPELDLQLKAVEDLGVQVRLEFFGHERLFDRTLLTLPPTVLKEIRFEPESPRQWGAIQISGMARAIKVAMFFRRPFWKDRNQSGRLMAPLPFQQVWDGTMGSTPVLNAYICGDEAEKVLASANPYRLLIQALCQVWPEAAAHYIDGCIHDWVNDTFALGAFSYLSAEAALDMPVRLGAAHGRVHFAGEHTAIEWTGFIEGALESAERAVKEILDA